MRREVQEEHPAKELHCERTDEEEQCERLFKELEKLFKKLGKTSNPNKIHAQIRDVTSKLKEAKGLIKDFEREARANGMPAGELAVRKKAMAAQLNNFISLKKSFAESEGAKGDLLNGAQGEVEPGLDGMSTQQLMDKGRKDIGEIDKALDRTLRLAAETQEVGKNVAGTVHGQTEQLEKLLDDLHEAEFTLKKASKVIGDITRGLLTDKCIAFLLLLTVVGVVAIIVVKIINPNRKKIQEGASAIVSNVTTAINNTDIGQQVISGAQDALNTTLGAVGSAANAASNANLGGRRMLASVLLHLLQLNETLY